MTKRRVVVVGTMSTDPFAGMAWMHMQIAVGLHRLGHDVYYIEMSGNWPYDPVRQSHVCDSDYALPYLQGLVERFGLADRWAYRRGYSDKQWFGPVRDQAEELLRTADAVLNVTGASRFAEEGLDVGRLVYFGTDPVHPEFAYAAGDPTVRAIIDEHDDIISYGENIGTPGCDIPPLPKLRGHARQPILLDYWDCGPPTRAEFTTVGNWKQEGRDTVLADRTLKWSKHHEFLRFIEVPRLSGTPVELATNVLDPSALKHGPNEEVRAGGLDRTSQALLLSNGWKLRDAISFTTDPFQYREYIQASRGEFTVSKQAISETGSGWFSERSACYLGAGRPVVTQNSGFDKVLPTGEGLFAFSTVDEAVDALERVQRDYRRHSKAARGIAEEYFRAETVMQRVLTDLGL